MSPTQIVAYLALFGFVGFAFMFANLAVGKLLRPKLPNEEKLEIYECGEPTIGSSFVQFDLRFYVVALLFLIFDVEVAFFFPWANVFGKANHLRDPGLAGDPAWAEHAGTVFGEMGVAPSSVEALSSAEAGPAAVGQLATQLAWLSFFDILVFFGIVMVGFFYVWKRGDLDWVRAYHKADDLDLERPEAQRRSEQEHPVLTA